MVQELYKGLEESGKTCPVLRLGMPPTVTATELKLTLVIQGTGKGDIADAGNILVSLCKGKKSGNMEREARSAKEAGRGQEP